MQQKFLETPPGQPHLQSHKSFTNVNITPAAWLTHVNTHKHVHSCNHIYARINTHAHTKGNSRTREDVFKGLKQSVSLVLGQSSDAGF